mmetsp:Transcript_23667/g.32304  ORF Transcript_23667/g.32304 Transcript_23667/m.32304 type:complete len:103 (-) Transcript_23667:102-410(-)
MKAVLFSVLLLSFLAIVCSFDRPSQFRWAVKIQEGENPDQVAEEAGFENLGQVAKLRNIYLFELKGHLRETRDLAQTHEEGLQRHSSIIWAEEQVPHRLVPR